MNRLDYLFKPKTIAIVGVSKKEDANSQPILKNLIGSDFKGIVYPVSTTLKSVRGVKTYQNIQAIPDSIDLVIIDAEVQEMMQIMEDCIAAKVKSAIILSGGFRLDEEQGETIYQKIEAKAKAAKIAILGASSYGFISTYLDLNASLFNGKVLKGKTVFISQSRSICSAILNWAVAENVGFSHFVSIGSMMDIKLHELINYFGMDMHTRNIMIYMESLSEARQFMSAAKAFSRNKPIIVLKSGQTLTGAGVIEEHTRRKVGKDAIFEAAFRRAGVLKVNTIEGLFDCAEALSVAPRPHSNRLAIVTNAGAPAVLAVDYLIKNGGKLAQLSTSTLEQLKEILPHTRFISNPVDVLANSSIERYKTAVNICLSDENVDGVLVILTSQTKSDVRGIAKEITKINNKTRKTIIASCVGELSRREISQVLVDGNVPTYCFPESAVYSFLKMYEYNKSIDLLYETPARVPEYFKPQKKAAKKLINAILNQNRTTLTFNESEQLLRCYDIPVLKYFFVETLDEALEKADQIGYPVVLKYVVNHGMKQGQSMLNLEDEIAVERAWRKLSFKKNGQFFIQKMIDKTYELSISSEKMPEMGPVISFGMGGVAVEVFNDVNHGIPPLNMALAQRIIENTKIYKLLVGQVGTNPINIESIQFLLVKFSYLLVDFPEIQQITLNPFIVDKTDGIVLDYDIVLDANVAIDKPYSHLIISPYPQKYIREITLKNGQNVLLRPIKPEDEPLEREMIKTFSEKTTFLRFFTTSFIVTHDFLTKFTNIDYDNEMAIVAELIEDGVRKLTGVVRIVGDAHGEFAEYAIVVADPWQGLGLGRFLTDFILDIARDMGFQRIEATLLRQNNGMRHIFEKNGFTIKAEDLETLKATLELN